MAELLLEGVRIYLFIGIAAAVLFCVFAIGRLDENATGTWIFRPLIAPGVILLWPLVMIRWVALRKGPEGGWDEAKRHQPPRVGQDKASLALVLLIPLILAICLTAVQPKLGKYDAPAIQIAPPPPAGISQ